MFVQEFRSDHLDEGDRPGAGRECATRSQEPVEVQADAAEGCASVLRMIDLGVAQVCATEVTSLRMTAARPAPADDSESYHVIVPVRGTVRLELGRRRVECRPDYLYVSGSQPFATGLTGPFRGVVAAVPRALLPLPAHRPDVLDGRRLPAGEGVAGLLAGFLVRLTEEPGAYRPADVPRLGAVTLELVTAVIGHLLDAESPLEPETRQQTLLLRIRSFIQQHVHDTELTPDVIAAAHHISTRYLHRLFQAHETSVTETVRRQRLERARRDLAEPALRATPIHRIAARWGFAEAAAFSRAFRAAYGMPPREYRDRALRAVAGA